MEKLVMKKGQMSIFLVANQDSPYYQSEAFDKLLAFIQKHPRECMIRDVNGKRSIVVKNVRTVETACALLEEAALDRLGGSGQMRGARHEIDDKAAKYRYLLFQFRYLQSNTPESSGSQT